jgi:hypothetical protein
MSSGYHKRTAVDVDSLVNFMNKKVYRGTPDHLQNLAGDDITPPRPTHTVAPTRV